MRSRRAATACLCSALLLTSAAGLGQTPPGSTPPSPAPAAPVPPAPAATGPAAAGATAPLAPPPPDAAAANKAAAQEHFERGLALSDKEVWDAALAEFLRSRELHPTRAAVTNAATCLRKLKRYDEALDLYEGLLRDFHDVPEALKTQAQVAILELRGQVGTIELDTIEPGGAITVDGRRRGEHPLLVPLRVGTGSHVVRLYREGFSPFEAGVEVAGGQTARVTARLVRLLEAGRLSVAEKSGKALDVVIDGNVVGQTPWAGVVAVGEHTVTLSGDERFGTLPAPVTVKAGQPAAVALVAEDLGTTIRIAPDPATASVALDGIFVGRGVWEGHLRPGAHTVELVADGYFKAQKPVKLERGAHQQLTLALVRDPKSPHWRKPGRVTLEVHGGAALSPSLGGDASTTCTGACSDGLAAGAYGVVQGGYELGSGIGFGVEAGYLRMDQTVRGHGASLQPVGVKTPDLGTADDILRVRGFLVGAWGGVVLGDRFPLRLRLGAGALVGSVSDTRSGTFAATSGASFTVGPLVQTPAVTWFYLDPEVRVGVRLGSHVELSAGVGVFFLLGPSARTWDGTQAVSASTDGQGTFAASPLTSPVLFAITPGLGARYDF